MRIALLTAGTRGDASPMVVLARELSGRGHDVVLGVSPNLVAWCHRAGVPAPARGRSLSSGAEHRGREPVRRSADQAVRAPPVARPTPDPHPAPVTDVQNVTTALAAISEHYQPHRLTSINDYDVKVVKLLGEFVWHTHPETDELFLVVEGQLTIQLRDRDVVLGPHDVFVVPRGVEHCPRADAEVHALLFEPKGTVNTGDAGGAMTSPLRELD